MLYAQQIRAARGMINMSQLELAIVTGLHISTIQKIEKDDKSLKKAGFDTIEKIKTALESRGIRFLQPKEVGNIAGIGIRYFPVNDKENEED